MTGGGECGVIDWTLLGDLDARLGVDRGRDASAWWASLNNIVYPPRVRR